MVFRQCGRLKALVCLCAASAAALPNQPGRVENGAVQRDVVVIGGGSGGTYAATALRDLNKTVAVVEHKDRLGGHTETYIDPATGKTDDIGVVVFHQLPVVRNYFARFDVPLTIASFVSSGINYYANFRTGDAVNYTPPDPTEGLARYAQQLAKYPYLEPGYDKLQYPLPADLLLPFGEFVQKYNLSSAVMTIFNYNQGMGDLLQQPTLYVMKIFGQDLVKDLGIGFLTTARHNNSEIYVRAADELRSLDSLFLSSNVTSIHRSAAGVEVTLNTPSGLRIIRAKALVIAIPPLLSNLDNRGIGLDLSPTEASLFAHFRPGAYWTGVLRNTGLPANTTVTNVDPANPDALPDLPGIYSISPAASIPGLWDVKYSAPAPLPDAVVQADILRSIQALRAKGAVPQSAAQPEFAVFKSHTPFELTVSVEQLQRGFYARANALQGDCRTWWTGAAWASEDSSLIWNYTRPLVEKLAATL